MFRQDKVTQMAARFLNLAGKQMPYLLLLKLLYLADKEMLLKWGKPISYDQWVSMDWGPVLSTTYDLIKGPPIGQSSYWADHIKNVGRYDVRL